MLYLFNYFFLIASIVCISILLFFPPLPLLAVISFSLGWRRRQILNNECGRRTNIFAQVFLKETNYWLVLFIVSWPILLFFCFVFPMYCICVRVFWQPISDSWVSLPQFSCVSLYRLFLFFTFSLLFFCLFVRPFIELIKYFCCCWLIVVLFNVVFVVTCPRLVGVFYIPKPYYYVYRKKDAFQETNCGKNEIVVDLRCF